MKFHYMLKKLQLHKEEYVLMQAISLFSPGDGLPQPVNTPRHDLQEAAAPLQGRPQPQPCSLLPEQPGEGWGSSWFLLGSVG